MLEADGQLGPAPVPAHELEALFEQTRLFWRAWLGKSNYRGRWREIVDRSAITLKLLIHAPTGAPVAAPTAGLPEQLGGERNWDYRYTWVRDGSFSVAALLGLGYRDEAEQFIHWLGDRIRERDGSSNGPLQIMYRVDGSPDLPEHELGHLAGHRDSRPVRIGNGAAEQIQLDIYGEMMDAVYAADRAGLELDHATWIELAAVIDWLCDNWDQPEAGIWETRGGDKDFVYGRLMSWVALDRAVRLAVSRGRPANVLRWMGERDAIYTQIMEDGFNADLGAFVQHYGSDVLDASLLKMALVGFVAPRDPLWLIDARRDGPHARVRQPGLPLRPGRITGRAPRRRGHVFDLHVLVRGSAGAQRAPARGAPGVREDARVRQPSRPLFGGDRVDRRPARQLSAGVYPPPLIRAAVTLDGLLDAAIDEGGQGIAR